MGIGVREEHQELQASVRRWTESHCGPSVPRSVLEADSDLPPGLWDAVVDQGWLGLAVDEAHGGHGYGVLELAVVVEELGRALLPGPFVPTALAALVLQDTSHEAVGDVVAGRTAAVDFAGTGIVLGATSADRVIVRAGSDDWRLTNGPGTPVKTLDPTRRLARVDAGGEHLAGVTDRRVGELAAVLLAAEAAGGAAWCLETATAYAKVREQFGRPIGQFQAIKHKLADLALVVEQARAAAWDAAVAVDDPEQAALPSAVAALLASEAFFRAAKDCIQTLGGIGFTWEHDAHMYLRRAGVIRQLLGGPERWRRRIADLAVAGTRRKLEIELPPEAESYRDEVRAFLASLDGLDRPAKRRRMADEGYLAPHWPAPWGRSAGATEQLVIDQEFQRAGVRRPHLQIGAWALPTIIVHGTPEQQERFVRPSLHGELNWCQLFSEPGAGSDLASLSTKAVRTDGGWLLTGQKVWTTMAREADWGICLARTNPDVPKHAGITYFLVDMRSEGIDVRPLREMTGLAMFNEVFLSDVFVPDDCVVGDVDHGWTLARTTLANERVSMASGSSFGGGVEALLALVTARHLDGDPVVLDEIGALVAEAQSVALLGYRTTARAVSGAEPGPEASVRKLLSAEHDQRVQELGLLLLGPDGAVDDGDGATWAYGFFANRCLTIAGGTSEVQRNVIAERVLGLPRDP